MAEKKENFFTKKWNLLINIAIGLVVLVSKFAIAPAINAHILQDKADYEKLSIFILAGILGLLLIPCAYFKAKKHTVKWAVAAVLVLIGALITHNRYNSYYNHHIAWHEEAKTSVIIGDQYIDIAQKAIDEYRKENNGIEPSKDLVVSSFNYPNGLWTNNELGRVYGNIVALYLMQVILFSVFAFLVVQALYCLNSEQNLLTKQ